MVYAKNVMVGQWQLKNLLILVKLLVLSQRNQSVNLVHSWQWEPSTQVVRLALKKRRKKSLLVKLVQLFQKLKLENLELVTVISFKYQCMKLILKLKAKKEQLNIIFQLVLHCSLLMDKKLQKVSKWQNTLHLLKVIAAVWQKKQQKILQLILVVKLFLKTSKLMKRKIDKATSLELQINKVLFGF